MPLSVSSSFKVNTTTTLVCASFEILLYCINIILFGCCVYIILKKDRAINKVLLYSSTVSFFLATTHVIITFIGLAQGIKGIASGADSELTLEQSDGKVVAAVTIYAFNEFVQDILLTWRLFIVWNYSKGLICLFPVILLAGEVVSGSIGILHLNQANGDVLSNGVEIYAICGWIINAVFHIYVTGGISYRLWRSGRRSAMIGGRFGYTYKGTVAMVVESGFLAVLCAIILLGCYAAGDIAGFAAVEVAAQMATTVPLLIIVRVGFGLKWGFSKDTDPISDDLPNDTRAIELPILSCTLAQLRSARAQGVTNQTSSLEISKVGSGSVERIEMP